MNLSFRNSISFHLHRSDDLISALQKYIRRGELEKAVYVGIELEMFSSYLNTDKDRLAKAMITNFVNRLRCIMVEDIGIADPSMPIRFDRLFSEFENTRHKDARRCIYQMIRMLCEAPKIRLISDIKAVFFGDYGLTMASMMPENKEIYANRDHIDPKAKGMYLCSEFQDIVDGLITNIINKSDSGFFWVGKMVKIGKRAIDVMFKVFKQFAKAECLQIINICEKYHKHFGMKNGGPEKSHRDYLMFAIWPGLYMFRDLDVSDVVTNIIDVDIDELYDSHRSRQAIVLDDYVFDAHTAKGRSLGKNGKDFAEVSAVVANESADVYNPLYRKIYMDCKTYDPAYKKVHAGSPVATSPSSPVVTSIRPPVESTLCPPVMVSSRPPVTSSLSLPVVTPMSEEMIVAIANAPIGQKPTSLYKATVYILHDQVVKGPYKDLNKLITMNLRYQMFTAWGDKVAGPFKIMSHGDRYYVSMPIIRSKNVVPWTSSGPTQILGGKTGKILDKSSLGIQELHHYLDTHALPNESIIYKSILHYIHRFIFDPITGDAAFRNIIIVDDEVYGIDYDDNRTDLNYDGVMSMLSGGSRWKKRDVDRFSKYILDNKDRFIEHLEANMKNMANVSKERLYDLREAIITGNM
jgi:hypothetical protein